MIRTHAWLGLIDKCNFFGMDFLEKPENSAVNYLDVSPPAR
jgi:hypothetical protein